MWRRWCGWERGRRRPVQTLRGEAGERGRTRQCWGEREGEGEGEEGGGGVVWEARTHEPRNSLGLVSAGFVHLEHCHFVATVVAIVEVVLQGKERGGEGRGGSSLQFGGRMSRWGSPLATYHEPALGQHRMNGAGGMLVYGVVHHASRHTVHQVHGHKRWREGEGREAEREVQGDSSHSGEIS